MRATSAYTRQGSIRMGAVAHMTAVIATVRACWTLEDFGIHKILQ